MDTITHGIVGALVGKALFAGHDEPAKFLDRGCQEALSSPTARASIVACTMGSIFPDIDIFAGQIAHNPLAIMVWHRNISHSLVMLPLWAALLAAVSLPLARWLRWKAPPFARLAGICAVGLATHIFLDVVTNFGTMVWSPLNYARAAWDWFFILDLTFTGIVLVPQLAAWCYREPEKFRYRAIPSWILLTAISVGGYALASGAGYGFPVWVVCVVSALVALVLFAPVFRSIGFAWSRANWCRVGIVLACAYLTCAAAMHRAALANVNEFAAEHHLPTENLAALPLPPTLTHWAGLIHVPQGVWRTTFHEPGGKAERTQFYDSVAQSNPFVEEAKKLHDVQVFLWFARFPIWRVSQQEGGIIKVDISDVRFFREEEPDITTKNTQPARLSGLRSNSAGFTFEVVFNSAGQVVSEGFKKPQP